MLKKVIYLSFYCSILALTSCKKPSVIEEMDEQDWFAGGGQTTFVTGGGAFGEMFSGMNKTQVLNHEIGDLAFEATFVTAPSPVNPGLGPLFNNVSCFACHINDGRGKAPNTGEPLVSMLIRLSVTGVNAFGEPLGVPGFGGQLQQRAITGKLPEASVDIQYSYQTFTFPDGTTYELRSPIITLQNAYMALPGGVMTSARVAPPVFGLGLLEAIPEYDLLALEDVNDANGDGISGKANYVWDYYAKKNVIGRFGWKANNPTVLQQTAGAYLQDMGITTFLFPQEASYGQSQYDGLNDDYELSDSLLFATTFYMQTLKAPARRNVKDAQVIRGKELFKSMNCTGCHTPKQKTAVNVAFAPLSNQTFYPYTDLLVHDMGTGLADNRPDHLANGNEWRTPPLWGIGLTEIVNGHSNFLHDGRARTLTEAIMWHGGEAENTKQKFANLSTADRIAVLKFLKSL